MQLTGDGLSTTDQEPVVLAMNAVGAVVGGATRHLTPFLGALSQVRPNWRVHVWATEGVSTEAWPTDVQVESVARIDPARRVAWETLGLSRAVVGVGADALLNLTNSGPLYNSVPSLLYQRNSIYFDPLWTRRYSGGARVEATARRLLAAAQAAAAQAVLVPSGAMAEYLLHWRYWPRSTKIHVIPHSVDSERFVMKERTWPPPTDRPLRLVCISQGYRHKDHDLLLRLTESLIGRGTDVELSVTVHPADDPDHVAGLLATSERLGIADHVRFLGRVSAPEDLYTHADIVVSSSITESFGFPILEAMASGAPVVASDIRASRELAGQLANYFAPGDPEDALRAIDDLLAMDPEDLADRLSAGRLVAEELCWSRNAESVARVVEGCLNVRNPPR